MSIYTKYIVVYHRKKAGFVSELCVLDLNKK